MGWLSVLEIFLAFFVRPVLIIQSDTLLKYSWDLGSSTTCYSRIKCLMMCLQLSVCGGVMLDV